MKTATGSFVSGYVTVEVEVDYEIGPADPASGKMAESHEIRAARVVSVSEPVPGWKHLWAHKVGEELPWWMIQVVWADHLQKIANEDGG